MRVRGRMSIVTVVSFVTSSKCASSIAIAHTVGSAVTLTTLGSVTPDGMRIIPSPDLMLMLETSGQKATEVKQGIGND